MSIDTSCNQTRILCMLILASLFSFSFLYAQGYGSIKGSVLDRESGDPIIGANIVIQGTSLGSATDIDGKFHLPVVPVGKWTIKVSCIGYAPEIRELNLRSDSLIILEFKMRPQVIQGQEVVVTVQARGQNDAINQQLISDKIANIVSSARIQELPDANAAESIGRLPGISLVRSGGEATQVVIRGLEPKYNSITIDGIALPSTSSGDRSTDLSMISSNSLEGIEVYKTVSADMDAAVIGGTVNFDIRRAKSNLDTTASISLLAQGGYNDLMDSYKDYKFVANVEKRFFNDKFGVFVQGIAQRQNLTSDQLGAYYYNGNLPVAINPDTIAMGWTTLTFDQSIQKRYDGTITLDYNLPDGNLSLLNFISHGTTTTEQHSELFTVANAPNNKDDIIFGTSLETINLNVISNILSYKQIFGSLKIDAKLSNAYSDNASPYGWYMDFQQQQSGTHNIPTNLTPAEAVQQGEALVDTSKMKWTTVRGWSDFTKQDDRQISLDVENKFNLSNEVSLALKGGGM